MKMDFAKKYEDDNLEEVIDGQITKLEELNVATVLIKGKQNVKEELQRVQAEVLKLSSSIIGIKNTVKTISLQNKRSIELLKLLGDLNKKILHQEKNVPHELIQGFQNATVYPNMLKCSVNPMKAQVPNSAKNAKVLAKSEMTTDCKRILFNEPEICPTIPFIMTEEFNYLPKYMRGRQTIDTFNTFISAINQTLIAKYTILSLGKAAAQKKGEMNLYLHYKNQEFDTRTEDGKQTQRLIRPN
ncbi:PREDICTED: spindle and kinetochore-associated protein 1-like isoform X2 [Vollenhovia emeryi]|uniref:spindle and kinetochore-associated protein 1-like isoform X2 n=1 Tax=Vollenhovia emeryi TaxID=411798 RepID=UPI0005F476F6|nr:PREDICTED: spindle and kinetochore-associated protein 1-like isoform X2 [Vollenhovia emeryi]